MGRLQQEGGIAPPRLVPSPGDPAVGLFPGLLVARQPVAGRAFGNEPAHQVRERQVDEGPGQAREQIGAGHWVAGHQLGDGDRLGVALHQRVQAEIGDVIAVLTPRPSCFAEHNGCGKVKALQSQQVMPDGFFIERAPIYLHEPCQCLDGEQRKPDQPAQEFEVDLADLVRGQYPLQRLPRKR